MANAINKNLEMVDVMQIQNSYRLQSEDQSNRNKEEDGAKRNTIKQGETIKSDLAIQGNRIYSDVAWKTTKIPGSQGTIQTGLGVYCELQQEQLKTKIQIQASTSKASSPLHVEAIAILLAAKIANSLQIQQVTFLTDNLTLARAAASKRATDPHVPWEIREQIAIFMQSNRNIEEQVYHIRREVNSVAHNCAHQAIRQSQSRPILSCSNSAHQTGRCPVLLSLQIFSLQEIVLHVVNCVGAE
jgi:hypothetical protein